MDSGLLTFAVLFFAGHNLVAGVHDSQSEERYQQLVLELNEPFSRTDLPEVIRILDRAFEGMTYSLKSLFRDEQYRILGIILESELAIVEAAYGQIFDDRSSLMHYIIGLDVPLPARFHKAAEFTLNARLRRLLDADHPDAERVASLLNEVRTLNVPLDSKDLEYAFSKNMETRAEEWAAVPHDLARLSRLGAMADMLSVLPFQVNLWKAQNLCFAIQQELSENATSQAELGDTWIEMFHGLIQKLRIRALQMNTSNVTICEAAEA
jgi:Domain of unknown function (DUF3536)